MGNRNLSNLDPCLTFYAVGRNPASNSKEGGNQRSLFHLQTPRLRLFPTQLRHRRPRNWSASRSSAANQRLQMKPKMKPASRQAFGGDANAQIEGDKVALCQNPNPTSSQSRPSGLSLPFGNVLRAPLCFIRALLPASPIAISSSTSRQLFRNLRILRGEQEKFIANIAASRCLIFKRDGILDEALTSRSPVLKF